MQLTSVQTVGYKVHTYFQTWFKITYTAINHRNIKDQRPHIHWGLCIRRLWCKHAHTLWLLFLHLLWPFDINHTWPLYFHCYYFHNTVNIKTNKITFLLIKGNSKPFHESDKIVKGLWTYCDLQWLDID